MGTQRLCRDEGARRSGIAVVTATTDRAAWLAERRSGIGGSDIAAICGISPWASPWSVWASKVGLAPDRDIGEWSPSMRLGIALERAIGDEFTNDTGLHVAGEQTLVRHRRFPHHFATVDGFVVDSLESDVDDALGVFEAKFTNDVWAEVPEHYVAQVQWQLHCTGLGTGWLGAAQSRFGRLTYTTFEIPADAERQAHLVAAAETFWNDYVVAGVPPPPDDHPRTVETITALWGQARTTRLGDVAFDDLETDLLELKDLKRDIAAKRKLCEHRENVIRARFVRAAELKDLDREAVSEGFVDGELAVTWRHQQRTDLDTEAVRAEHGDRYDHTRTIPVLRLHGRFK